MDIGAVALQPLKAGVIVDAVAGSRGAVFVGDWLLKSCCKRRGNAL